MKTTIVVSQRERVEAILWSLKSLFSTVSPAVPIIVVSRDLPNRIEAELRRLQGERPFQFISKPHFITPSASRNIGARLARTEFIAFVDNDLEYEPGWLGALEKNAERHGSSVVAPLTCIGPPRATTIHHAGGFLHADGDPDHPTISERHRLMGEPIERCDPSTAPEENEIAEFHCVLVRRDTFDDIGFFDERLITREQVDFALRLKVAEKTVTFERNAVVTHMRGAAFSRTDLDYFLERWSEPRALASLAAFETSWGVSLEKEKILKNWIWKHRVRAIGVYAPRIHKLLGKARFREFVVPLAEAVARRRGRRAEWCAPAPYAPPTPPSLEPGSLFARIRSLPTEVHDRGLVPPARGGGRQVAELYVADVGCRTRARIDGIEPPDGPRGRVDSVEKAGCRVEVDSPFKVAGPGAVA